MRDPADTWEAIHSGYPRQSHPSDPDRQAKDDALASAWEAPDDFDRCCRCPACEPDGAFERDVDSIVRGDT